MISEILYFVFVFPLESILGFGLERIFGVVKSYGLSIIILSLFVNIFLLKIFILTDKKAEFESARKKRLDSRIKAWKSVYKKAKLFAFTQTLYRQNHYHPIFALSALGGLAVQIPFFYAMYFVVKNATLSGESFLWISDLSAPDLILGVHLLPILMTIISLVNVWIVAKEKGAKIQGIIIALIFLVLLYQMPSALVLYWTSNMAFSLIRAIFAKFKFGNSPLDKHSTDSLRESNNHSSLRGNSSPKRLCEAPTHTCKSKPIVILSEAKNPRIASDFVLDSSAFSKPQNDKIRKSTFFILRKPLKIAVISLTVILAIGLCATFSLMIYAKNNVQTSHITFNAPTRAKIHYDKYDFLLRSKTISRIDIMSVAWDKAIGSSDISDIRQSGGRYASFKGSLDLEKGTNLGSISYTMDFTPLLKNLFRYYFVILGAMLWIYLLLCAIVRFHQTYRESNAQIYRKITNCTILCIAFLICVFTPYQLYNTDITQFDSTQTYSTLSALFGAFMLCSFIAIYALSFIPKRFFNFVAFLLSVILFSGIVYSFILVGDYGAMDHFVLQKAPQNNPKQTFEFIAVLTLGIALAAFTLTKLIRVWQIAFATLFIVSGVNALQIIDKRIDFAKIAQENTRHSERSESEAKNPRIASDSILDSSAFSKPRNDEREKLPYKDELFSYSKTHKNIVVIVLDMFSGSHMPYILEQFPYFKTQLDGFVLFPNTLSTTNATAHSIATVIAGEHYAVYNMNARKQNLANEISKAYTNIGVAFADSGFSVGYMSDMYDNLIKNPKINLISNYKIFEPYFNEKYNLTARIQSYRAQTKHYESLDLISFGLFRFTPEWHLRGKIYNNGAWLYKKLPNFLNAIASASNTYAPTHFLNADLTKPTFKFFHTSMTHFPYSVYFDGKECRFGETKSAWEDYPHKIKRTYPQDRTFKNFHYLHYDSEACAFKYIADYIENLKNLGIYDNTQIFIVSDHGGDDSIGTPRFAHRPDALLLFKDFEAKGALRVDNHLMANYDIASIFCANLPNGCPNVGQNILKNYPTNREVIYTIPYHWILEKHKKDEWILNKAYKVRGNIYDEKNWTDISDEKYGIVNVSK